MAKETKNKDQIIISVSREFGSGGKSIAKMLGKEFSLPVYDYNLLQKMAGNKHVALDELKKYDELPHLRLMSRTVKGFTNSPFIIVAMKQFEYIKKMADKGESFIIVGRCGETVLKDNENLISIFILGDMEDKIKKVQKTHNLSEHDAKNLILKTNKQRKQYHNYYCDTVWGDSRNYDISINSSRLGLEKTADFLTNYIKRRLAEKSPTKAEAE